MAQAVLSNHDHVADMSMLPEVDIGATDSGCAYMNKAVVRSRLRNVTLDKVEGVRRVGVHSKVLGLALDYCSGRHPARNRKGQCDRSGCPGEG